MVLSRSTYLSEPKFVKIIEYCRFSYAQLREESARAVMLLQKLSFEKFQADIEILKRIAVSTQQEQIDEAIIEHRYKRNDLQKMLSRIREMGEDRNSVDNPDV